MAGAFPRHSRRSGWRYVTGSQLVGEVVGQRYRIAETTPAGNDDALDLVHCPLQFGQTAAFSQYHHVETTLVHLGPQFGFARPDIGNFVAGEADMCAAHTNNSQERVGERLRPWRNSLSPPPAQTQV